MTSRIMVIEVPDVRTEDDIALAIGQWNAACGPGRRIEITQCTALIVG